MASVSSSGISIPHTVRTANDPRQTGLYNAQLTQIEQVNSTIRLLRLSLDKNGPPFQHLPGQWLDVHIPSIPQAGGFTITSPPSTATTTTTGDNGYVELAIQISPRNPPAAYLWRPSSEILDTWLMIRVGGRFVYPPPQQSPVHDDGDIVTVSGEIRRAVFVAGGVGINPIMSMLSALDTATSSGRSSRSNSGAETTAPTAAPPLSDCIKALERIHVLYTCRESSQAGEKILFYDRIRSIAERKNRKNTKKTSPNSETRPNQEGVKAEAQDGEVLKFNFSLFTTQAATKKQPSDPEPIPAVPDSVTNNDKDKADSNNNNSTRTTVQHHSRRITHADLIQALGPVEERHATVAYVCGPPAMTDEFVHVLRTAEGMGEERVLCEKWW